MLGLWWKGLKQMAELSVYPIYACLGLRATGQGRNSGAFARGDESYRKRQ
ncbi:hypothetical protein [Asticcacaulis sp.]